MSENGTKFDEAEALAAILAEARDKYTVHDCNECDFRKSCERSFDSDECKSTRKSISLALGIEDGYFTKLLDRIEAAAEQERRQLRSLVGRFANCHEDNEDFGALLREARFVLADTPYAVADGEPVAVPHGRVAEKAGAESRPFVGVDLAKDKPTFVFATIAPGNAAAMREALERLDEHLHEDDYDGHLFFNLFDYDPKEEIRAALSAPARNCDWFQTADEARDAVKAAFANTMLLDDRQLRAVCDWLFDSAEGGAE